MKRKGQSLRRLFSRNKGSLRSLNNSLSAWMKSLVSLRRKGCSSLGTRWAENNNLITPRKHWWTEICSIRLWIQTSSILIILSSNILTVLSSNILMVLSSSTFISSIHINNLSTNTSPKGKRRRYSKTLTILGWENPTETERLLTYRSRNKNMIWRKSINKSKIWRDK